MDSQQLEAFVTLTLYENMSQAAEVLHTSQPQISKLISSLEAELRVKLFDRVGRGIVLNEHGHYFLEYAKQALDTMAAGRYAMSTVNSSLLGQVSVGLLAYGPILKSCVAAFREKNPQVTFRFSGIGEKSRLDPHMVDMLLCPMIGTHYSFENQYPVNHLILEEQYYLVSSPRFAGCPVGKTVLSRSECSRFPYIAMGTRNAHAITNDVTILNELCASTDNPNPNITYEVNDFFMKMLLVRDGVAMSLLPESCLQDARIVVPDLQLFSIEDMVATRRVVLARKPDDAMTSVSLEFWNHAVNYFSHR